MRALLLAAIVALAIALRVLFFVGLVSGNPQDDGVYYGNALAVYTDGLGYLERYRSLPADYLANPIDQFPLRPMITYPIAASFALFGPGEVTAALWGLLCSVSTVLIVYRLGTVIHGPSAGLVAAVLCSFYPLEVVNATRILSDVQVGLFTSAGLLLLVEGSARRRAWPFALAGVAAGAVYLANPRGLMVLGLFLAGTAVHATLTRTGWKPPLWIAVGFLAVFGIEALVYSVYTGDPLLSYHVQRSASRFKYLHEPVTTVDWGLVQIEYTNGRPFELLRSVFVGDNRPIDQFGFFFYLFAIAAVFSLVRRRAWWLAAAASAMFVHLEFGPLLVWLDTTAGTLHYQMVFKQDRFLLTMSAPLLVLAADLLDSLRRRSRVATALVLLVLMVTSLTAIAYTRRYYRAGLSDLRQVTSHILAHPDRTFLGDLWMVEHVRIFSRHRAGHLQVLSADSSPATVDGNCLVLGGGRGVELLADYVESTLPSFARQVLDSGVAPPGWTQTMTIEGPTTTFRRKNLTVYCADRSASRRNPLPSP